MIDRAGKSSDTHHTPQANHRAGRAQRNPPKEQKPNGGKRKAVSKGMTNLLDEQIVTGTKVLPVHVNGNKRDIKEP
jgi:hypothetical protein